ncbi:MAG: HdeA/HdeB family chaperone [Candidatus Binatia bacterium]
MLKRAPIFVGLLLTAISPSSAQVSIDVAKITCQQFATSKVANPDRIALWLNGYFHGKRGDMIVETQELAGDTREVQDYCIKNPDVRLMQAVETLFGSRN